MIVLPFGLVASLDVSEAGVVLLVVLILGALVLLGFAD